MLLTHLIALCTLSLLSISCGSAHTRDSTPILQASPAQMPESDQAPPGGEAGVTSADKVPVDLEVQQLVDDAETLSDQDLEALVQGYWIEVRPSENQSFGWEGILAIGPETLFWASAGQGIEVLHHSGAWNAITRGGSDLLVVELPGDQGSERAYLRLDGPDLLFVARQGWDSNDAFVRTTEPPAQLPPESHLPPRAVEFARRRGSVYRWLDTIRGAEKGHWAEWDRLLPVEYCPPEVPGSVPVEWSDSLPCAKALQESFTFGSVSFLEDLQGSTYCRFRVVVAEPEESEESKHGDFVAEAECDVDGDGVISVFRATWSERAKRITAATIY